MLEEDWKEGWKKEQRTLIPCQRKISQERRNEEERHEKDNALIA